MPFMTREEPCKVCGESNKLTRVKYHKINNKSYIQSTCRDCETKQSSQYQKENLSYFREKNKEYYLKKVGSLVRNMHHTPESRKKWYKDKANRRCTRAKQARRYDEFTLFVYSEAHELRKLRNITTKLEWHVDHVIPLRGKLVSGLHVWNNFAVIPKVENLRKGNYHSVHA